MSAKLVATGAAREIVYPTTEAEIARTGAEFAALKADTPEGYKKVVTAIAVLRGTRTAIEKRRVELKAEALEFGRKVDGVAKKLTALVSEIEDPLQERKKAIDKEDERIKREAERAEMIALEAKLKAEREAEEEKLRAARAVEDARLKAEADRQAAERKRIADERAALEAKQREVDAKAEEVAKREAAARPAPVVQHIPPLKVAARQPAPAEYDPLARVPAPAPAAAADDPAADQLAAEIAAVRDFTAEIRALAARAPALERVEPQGAIAWAVGRLEHLAASLDGFKPKAG